MSADKKPERERVRALEKMMSSELLSEMDGCAFGLFLGMPEYAASHIIFTYVGVRREPDTIRFLIRRALRDGKTVAVPLVEGKEMTARVLLSVDELRPGTFGVPEPSYSAELVPKESIDIAVVPAVTFDRSGNRLGHGAGYYDRYLSGTTFLKVGIGRERLLADKVPVEEHDVPVDVLITDEALRDFRYGDLRPDHYWSLEDKYTSVTLGGINERQRKG